MKTNIMENYIKAYIREHKDEFINSVDSNWIKQHPIEGYTTQGIQKKLNMFCDVKIHQHKEGKKVIKTRIYTLKEELFNEIGNEIDNFAEPIKYVDVSTQTTPIKKKSINNQIKEFYNTEYKQLPYDWRPRQYYEYYNEHHNDKVSYDKFIKYMPYMDYIILS